MKPEWKDEVRRGEVEGSTMHLSSVRIAVHRHMDSPGNWFVSAYGVFRLDTRRLESTTLEEAKTEALDAVTNMVDKLQTELAEISS